jgi:hypothetical protein
MYVGSMLLHTINDDQLFFSSYVHIGVSIFHHYLCQSKNEVKFNLNIYVNLKIKEN